MARGHTHVRHIRSEMCWESVGGVGGGGGGVCKLLTHLQLDIRWRFWRNPSPPGTFAELGMISITDLDFDSTSINRLTLDHIVLNDLLTSPAAELRCGAVRAVSDGEP